MFSYQNKHNGTFVFAEKCHLCSTTNNKYNFVLLFLSSYQDKKNKMIPFTEKCCLCPPTSKKVPDSFADNSNPIKVSRYCVYIANK